MYSRSEARIRAFFLLIACGLISFFGGYLLSAPFILLIPKLSCAQSLAWIWGTFLVFLALIICNVIIEKMGNNLSTEQAVEKRSTFATLSLICFILIAVLGVCAMAVIRGNKLDDPKTYEEKPTLPHSISTDKTHTSGTNHSSSSSTSKPSSNSSSNSSSSSGHYTGYYKDPYNVHDYNNPDEFADDWGDYFDSYEEAEDFWDDNY